MFALPNWIGLHLAGAATGVGLITAAGLKALSNVDTGSGMSQGLSLAEAGVGVWLIFGRSPRHKMYVTAVCFSAFACFAAFKAFSGTASCSCFGETAVSPWLTLLAESAIAGGAWRLSMSRKPNGSARDVRLAGTILTGGVALLLGLCTYAAWSDFEVWSVSDQTIAAPAVGSRWTLVDDVGTADNLRTGEWLAVVSRRNCEKCQSALKSYAALTREMSDTRRARVRLAVIEVGEMTPYPKLPVRVDLEVDLGNRLGAKFPTPFAVHLKNGVVLSVEGEALDRPRNAR